MTGFVPVLDFAKRLTEERVQPGDRCIDATVGNGSDTAFLASLVGRQGTVYGFDIQSAALKKAASRISAAGIQGHVQLMYDSHARMSERIPLEEHGCIAAVMFNLGYLPGGDHTIVTLTESTLGALNQAFQLLKPGGILTAVLYTGHPGGLDEADAVCRWAGALDQQEAQVLQYRFLNQAKNPPFLAAVYKMK